LTTNSPSTSGDPAEHPADADPGRGEFQDQPKRADHQQQEGDVGIGEEGQQPVFRRDAVGFPIIWIVEPATLPAVGAGLAQAPEDCQATEPALTQSRVGIVPGRG
jgi:hypothetical protein